MSCRAHAEGFDEKETLGETHLNAITKNFEPTARSARARLSRSRQQLFGERAWDAGDKVVPAPEGRGPNRAWGGAHHAGIDGSRGEGRRLDELAKTEQFWAEKLDKRQLDEDFKKAVVNLKPEERKRVVAALAEQSRWRSQTPSSSSRTRNPANQAGIWSEQPRRQDRGRRTRNPRGQRSEVQRSEDDHD